MTPPDEFRAQVRADILAAFGFDRPPSRSARWRRWLPAQRRFRRRLLALERASAEARAREAEFAATLPARMDAAAAELNERLADGTRFEWTTTEDPQ